MIINRTLSNMRTQKGKTQNFTTSKGVWQGDALSTSISNRTLEYVVRNRRQILSYANDTLLRTKNR